MKNWKETRNYRRIKDNDGNIVANIITIDGEDVEVTEEVFLAYSQADRRERYLMENATANMTLSLEQMQQDQVQLNYVGVQTMPSAEECCLEREEEAILSNRRQIMLTALAQLSDSDRELITALFWEHISIRTYASKIGVSDMAVRKRRDRILKQMRKFFQM